MFWDILEKVSIVMGIISSVVGLINISDKVLRQKKFSLISYFRNGDSNSIGYVFLMSLTIYGVISIIALPLALIYPDSSILEILGYFWLAFPLLVLFFWLDGKSDLL